MAGVLLSFLPRMVLFLSLLSIKVLITELRLNIWMFIKKIIFYLKVRSSTAFFMMALGHTLAKNIIRKLLPVFSALFKSKSGQQYCPDFDQVRAQGSITMSCIAMLHVHVLRQLSTDTHLCTHIFSLSLLHVFFTCCRDLDGFWNCNTNLHIAGDSATSTLHSIH